MYLAIILINFYLFFQYVKNNKESDNDWFRLESNKEGTRWFGKCWYIHNLLKYEFEIEFDVSNCFFSIFIKFIKLIKCFDFLIKCDFFIYLDTCYISYNIT